MIYEVVAINPKNDILRMPLADPHFSGINVKNVTGITPIGGEIYITPFASIDGGIFAGARVPSRNIVLTLGMMNNPTDAEDSRMKVYDFFRIKDKMTLIFSTSSRILQIDGYVESVDVDIFSQEEIATISVICVDPWFYSQSNRALSFAGISPTFEFSFSNESLTDNLIEFGNISIDTRTDIIYQGDITTGFELRVTFISEDFHNIYFYNMDTRERLTVLSDQIDNITGSPLSAGDELYISTISGDRHAYLLRGGEFLNVIGAIDKDSTWFQLSKGGNTFAFSSDQGVENIMMHISYRDAYAGV